MSEPDPPLPAILLDKILASTTTDIILVGGQALIFWAQFYDIDLNAAGPAITRDADFVGRYEDAVVMAEKIGGTVTKPKMGDHTPNTAIVLVPRPDIKKSAVIDFIDRVEGIDPNQLSKKAVLVEYDGHEIRILHPVDCLISRISNINRLPGKQTNESVAQAKLAILVARNWFKQTLESGADDKSEFHGAEKLASFGSKREIKKTLGEFDLDLIQAIPHEEFPENFRQRRWPQICNLLRRDN